MTKGLIYNLISRIIFVAGGYAIHIYVARLLGPEKYGTFGICVAIIAMCYIFLDNGSKQILSHYSARFPNSAKSFIKQGITVQLIFSFLLALTIALFSKNIAYNLNDNGLIIPLYLIAIIIIIQSLNYVFMGVLNGLKEFGRENILVYISRDFSGFMFTA